MPTRYDKLLCYKLKLFFVTLQKLTINEYFKPLPYFNYASRDSQSAFPTPYLNYLAQMYETPVKHSLKLGLA